MRTAIIAATLSFVLLTTGCGSTESAQDPGGTEMSTTTLPVGAQAPAFDAHAHDGSRQNLAELQGKNVVLFFYPKDDTPG